MAPLIEFQNENTFLTMSAEGQEDKYHEEYEQAVAAVRKRIQERSAPYPLIIAGEAVETDDTFEVVNPADHIEVVGEFAKGTEDDVNAAVDAAKAAFPAWRRTPWEERCEIFERAAELVVRDKFRLAATMTIENGKNRHEAVADVDEAIDFLRFYPAEMRRNNGYVQDTGEPAPGEHCEARLRPYGVFGVISPFNFPFAILVGMTTGAVLTGNTAVVKPASATPLIAHEFFRILTEAGLPDGVANLVTGGGRAVGQPIVEHPDVRGVVFTGSREVGIATQTHFMENKQPGPVIAELGGKNAVIITENADMDKAVRGVWKAAFGFGGQKCSATSRVYVHRSLKEEFTRRLVEAAREVRIGRPEEKETFLGPVIDEAAVERFKHWVKQAEDDGEVLCGGDVHEEYPTPGWWVEPTVIDGLPTDHDLVYTELFLPVVALFEFDSLDEAIAEVNKTDYGLTSGIFSEDQEEIATWFDRVEAGVTYANRHKSATTGALVHGQPFGGWKWSGTTGKCAGGIHYLPQFMHEQTRTIMRD